MLRRFLAQVNTTFSTTLSLNKIHTFKALKHLFLQYPVSSLAYGQQVRNFHRTTSLINLQQQLLIFKNQVDDLQKKVNDLQHAKDLASVQEQLNELQLEWTQVKSKGRTFMSNCTIADGGKPEIAMVIGKNNASERQKEMQEMANIMQSMDTFMQNCVVLKNSDAKVIQVPNEAITDLESNMSKTCQNIGRQSHSYVPPTSMTITNSIVHFGAQYNNQGQFIHMYMFLIISGACVAILLVYFTDNNANKPTKITNVPPPYTHYIESHWIDELENKIADLLANNKASHPIKIAIAGLPGSGKTDLAKYYVHKHFSELSLAWVINADTLENLWRNYHLLANELKIENSHKISGEDNQSWHERICYKVNQYLSEHPGWVLIFDNVEQLPEISKFLPACNTQKGTIIFTTQNVNLMDSNHRIDISKGLNQRESTQLLYNITGLPPDKSAFALAASLDHLPLYLLIAGSIIFDSKTNAPKDQWSYASYNEHIQQLSIKEIEDESAPYARQLEYHKTQHAVIHDAINRLNRLNMKAYELLKFCSYISPTNIMLTLLRDFVRLQNHGLSDEQVKQKCNNMLLDIQKFSLLQQIPGQSAYNIHRTTQEIVRNTEAPGACTQQMQAKNMLDAVLMSVLPIFTLNTIATNDAIIIWQPMMPHMISLASHTDFLEHIHQEELIKFLSYLVSCQNIIGDQHKALRYSEQALALAEKYYGEEHNEVARILINLGNVYYGLGKAKKSQLLYQRALDILIKHDGNKNCEVAKLLSKLGSVYYNLGDPIKARELSEEALPILKQEYGENHYEVARVLFNLGNAYHGLSKPSQAKELHQKALPIFRKHYGEEHYEVARVLVGLGNAYYSLNQLTQARASYEQALQIKKKHYGEKHYEVARILSRLGSVYYKLGDAVLAKELTAEALPTLKKHYGEDHYEVTRALTSLKDIDSNLNRASNNMA